MTRRQPANPRSPTHDLTLEAIRQHPGCSAQELADRLGLSWSTINYHVRILTDEGHLMVERPGRGMRIFPAEVPAVHRTWLAALLDVGTARVLHAVLEAPGSRVPQLSRELGFDQRLLRRHLTRLEKEKLVRKDEARRGSFMANPAPTLLRQQLAARLGLENPVRDFRSVEDPAPGLTPGGHPPAQELVSRP